MSGRLLPCNKEYAQHTTPCSHACQPDLHGRPGARILGAATLVGTALWSRQALITSQIQCCCFVKCLLWLRVRRPPSLLAGDSCSWKHIKEQLVSSALQHWALSKMFGYLRHVVVINAGSPGFSAVAAEIWDFHEGADILGYNALSFHVPLLAAEFIRMTASGISGVTVSGAENDSKFQVITMMR